MNPKESEVKKQYAINAVKSRFNQTLLAFRNATFDLDPEYDFRNKDNPNINIYIETQLGDIEGRKLTFKEAAEKYNISEGEERVNQIVDGIGKGIQERINEGDKGSTILNKIVTEVPEYLEQSRSEFKKLTE